MKTMLFAVTLLVGLNSFAGGTVGSAQDQQLAHVKVCSAPQNALLLKSMEITLTATQIHFEIENGPGRVQMGMGERASMTNEVVSIENVGLLKRGLKVKFRSHDSAGPTIETWTIYKDSVDQYGDVIYADDCKN